MIPTLRIAPVSRDAARAFVAEHHSHHAAHKGEKLALAAFTARELVGVSVLGRPKARAIDDLETWELTRLCVGPGAPRHTASRLLGRSTRTAIAAGVTLLVSYTRIDERGTCYLAANWRPVELRKGEAHTHGNRSQRWLPGLYEPSTEIIDRVRWEYGPRAGAVGCDWNGERWIARERSAA